MNKKTVSSETGYIAPVLRTHIVKVEGIICESQTETYSDEENWGGKDGWN